MPAGGPVSSDPAALLPLVVLAFLLAGTVKGVIGMGMPTVAVGTLSLVMPPVQAATLLVLPALVTNLWQMCVGAHLGALVRRLGGLLAGLFAGTLLGAQWLTAGRQEGVMAVLAIALLAYALLGLFSVRFSVPRAAEALLSPLAGAATGLVSGATGIFVVPLVPYLQSLNLARDEMIQALGLTFTVATVALAGGLFSVGMLWAAQPDGVALALGAAVLGVWIGQRLRQRLSPERFRIALFVGLAVLGAVILRRALHGLLAA
jgi:uncharacterized protein